MTHPMTDERLDELREADSSGHLRMVETSCVYESGNVLVSDVDFRSLLARLDAAEDLLREVARESDVCFFEVGKWMSTEIKIATLEKCRSYLR